MKNKVDIGIFIQTRRCAEEILTKIKKIKSEINICFVVSDKEFKIELDKIYKKKYHWIKNNKNYEKKLLNVIKINKKIYGFSFQHKWRISKDVIEKLPMIFNFHFGDIPRYRGHHPIIFAMLNNEKYIKGTIHVIDLKLDRGYLFKKILIKNTYLTSYEIECLMSEKFSDIFVKLINKIKNNHKIKLKKILSKGTFNSINDLKNLKEIKSFKELKTKILAFDYDPHEPAYIKIAGKKIYLKRSLFF